MEYVVLLTRRGDINPSWRAAVPVLPDCVVEAPSRGEAIERIREKIADVANQTEVLRLQVPAKPKTNNDFDSDQPSWQGFGIFSDDPTWGKLFDRIEEERNAHLVGG